MDDLISRQDAIEVINKLMEIHFDRKVVLGKVWQQIKDLPSVQRKGHWININEGKWNVWAVFKCSECGEIDNRIYETDNFCPNCGADMRGEDDG